MKYKILFTASILILLASVGGSVLASSSNWFPSAGNIRPVLSTWGLQIPGISTGGGTECLQISSTGVFSASGGTCAGTPAATALDSIGDPTASSSIETGNTNWTIGTQGASSTFEVNGVDQVVSVGLDFVPFTDGVANLGNDTLQWGFLYLNDAAEIDFGVGDITLAHSANNLAFSGGTFDFSAASTTLPVISTGVWEATDIGVAHGGTGASTAAGARTNLGLVIGTDVQAFDAGLLDIAGLAVTDSNFIVGNGTNWVAETGATARTSLGLTIGTDVQAFDSELSDIASTTATKGDIITSDGTDWLDFPVGADGTFLIASSTASNGLSWISRTWGDYLTETGYEVDVDQEVVERTAMATFADEGFQASSTLGLYLHNAVDLQEIICTTSVNASSTFSFEWRSARYTAGTSTLSAELTSAGEVTASSTSFSVSHLDADGWIVPVIVSASSTGAWPDATECAINFKVSD